MRWIGSTILLMAGVAALVIWGGEHLARQPLEVRHPVERERVLDFTATLQEELRRVEELYESNLLGLLGEKESISEITLGSRAEQFAGVRECWVFDGVDQVMQARVGNSRLNERLPEVVIEGGKRPFDAKRAVVLSLALMSSVEAAEGIWLRAPDDHYRVFVMKLGKAKWVAVVVDMREIQSRMQAHLESWAEGPFAPLRDSVNQVVLTGGNGGILKGERERMQSGPAALVIPIRTKLGEWQIEAWDQLEVVHTHDAVMMASAIAVAGVVLILGVVLEAQQRRAIRLAENRVSFVNRVSHELASPLTNMLLNLDLALGLLRERPAQAEARLKLVGEEVQRLARLVSNVLTFSRKERKSLELKPQSVVPDEVIEGMLEPFRGALARREIEVEWKRGAGEVTMLDPDALAQIVGNLISNVEKYGAGGKWLGLESWQEGARLRIRVSDRGPGIPASYRERIFEAFERVNQGVNEGASGTGLGLAIARDLARKMGGDLVLIDSEGGAIFECELPGSGKEALDTNPMMS